MLIYIYILAFSLSGIICHFVLSVLLLVFLLKYLTFINLYVISFCFDQRSWLSFTSVYFIYAYTQLLVSFPRFASRFFLLAFYLLHLTFHILTSFPLYPQVNLFFTLAFPYSFAININIKLSRPERAFHSISEDV